VLCIPGWFVTVVTNPVCEAAACWQCAV
jgi:hypothetical protein